MNCLAYALRFWKKEPKYRLFYNSDHVINLPLGKNSGHVVYEATGFSPVEEYGYEYFSKAFDELLDEYEKKLLKKYFKIEGVV